MFIYTSWAEIVYVCHRVSLQSASRRPHLLSSSKCCYCRLCGRSLKIYIKTRSRSDEGDMVRAGAGGHLHIQERKQKVWLRHKLQVKSHRSSVHSASVCVCVCEQCVCFGAVRGRRPRPTPSPPGGGASLPLSWEKKDLSNNELRSSER